MHTYNLLAKYSKHFLKFYNIDVFLYTQYIYFPTNDSRNIFNFLFQSFLKVFILNIQFYFSKFTILLRGPLLQTFVVNPFSSPSSNRFPRKMLSIFKLLEIHASFTAHLPPVVGPLEKPRKTARKRKLTITNRDAKTERRKRKRKKMQGKPENRARNWNCRLKSGTGLR